MFKEQMDAQTILFKGVEFCKAYSLAYLNEHFTTISPYLQNVTEIYYKFNASRNSWICYKDALVDKDNLNLSYSERIIHGLIKHKIPSLDLLPETEFIDRQGFTYMIGPRDGLDTRSIIRPLNDLSKKNIKMGHWERDENGRNQLINGYGWSAEHNCKYLVVKFKANISEALVILNGLYEDYEIYNSSTIIYYEKDGLSFPKELNPDYNPASSEPEHAEFKLDVNGNPIYLEPEYGCSIVPYIWKNVDKSEPTIPIDIKNEWIEFAEPITSSSLIFYNRVMYFYTVNQYNDCKIKLETPDRGNVTNFLPTDEIKRIDFTETISFTNHTTGEIETVTRPLKQQRLIGLFNTSDSNVYFSNPVNNGIITYNGITQAYIIRPDKKSIKFKIPYEIYQINNKLVIDPDTRIYCINFYSGDLDDDMSYKMPQAELTTIANKIITDYDRQLSSMYQKLDTYEAGEERVFIGYEDVFSIETNNQTNFQLKYKPIEHTINMYVNGVKYERDIFFLFEYINSVPTVIWKYTSYNDGFDLKKDKYRVTIEYSLNYYENNISDVVSFKALHSHD